MRRPASRSLRVLLPLLVALGLTVAGAGVAVEQPSATVVGRVRVVLLAPREVSTNALAQTSNSIIALAGILAQTVDATGGPLTVEPNVSLASRGVREGYSVRQPDHGGQWDHQFTDPAVDVQATGPTQARAEVQMSQALDRVATTLTRLQDEHGVPASARVRIHLSPTIPVYSVQKGSRTRALAVSGLVGAMLVAAVLTRIGRVRFVSPVRVR